MRLRQATVWFLSICAHETTLLQMDGFAFFIFVTAINPLNAELNPICYLLALLAHHFLHVSRYKR